MPQRQNRYWYESQRMITVRDLPRYTTIYYTDVFAFNRLNIWWHLCALANVLNSIHIHGNLTNISSWYVDRLIKTRTHKSVFYKGSTAKRLKTKRWAVLDSTVSFSHYVYLLQGIHSRTFCLHTQTNFRFHRQKVSFPQLAWGDFHAHLLASPALISI